MNERNFGISPANERRPRFLWRGLLILLPVVVLAGAGLFALRQDKLLARLEATERAQGLAEEMVQACWRELTSGALPDDPAFEIDATGQLLFPPPYSSVPEPHALDPAQLSPEQRRLWQEAHTRSTLEDPVLATEAWREFLRLSPPREFAARAHFNLGVALVPQNAEEAGQHFRAAAEVPAEVTTESGLPLRPLALLKWLETATPTNAIGSDDYAAVAENLCSNAVVHPGPLTPELLRHAAQLPSLGGLRSALARWQDEWTEHQFLRELHAAAQREWRASAHAPLPVTSFLSFSTNVVMRMPAPGAAVRLPRLFWLTLSPVSSAPPPVWLASRTDESATSSWIVCRSGEAIRRMLVGQAELSSSMIIWTVTASELPPRRRPLRHPAISPPAERELSAIWPRALPPYFGVSLSAAGRDLLTYTGPTWVSGGSGKPAHASWVRYEGPVQSPPPVLATASRIENGIEYLRCQIHLNSPQMLYARQRHRSILFTLLIGVSAVAALIGFLSAWRAFQKQQRLAEMRTNFVSSVSHELRAPIASVRLMAESLDRGVVAGAGQQREYFRFIVQECRRLSSMIENVLDIARIDQGRKQYQVETTDLGRLVQETVKLMEPYAAERGVQVRLTLPEEALPQPLLDGRAVQQAVINLLDNAIKHSPAGETVAVVVEVIEAPGTASANAAGETPAPVRILRLSIADHGPGIPPEEQERVFERFYRRGSELRRETPGVGIGLSIVKHTVEAHGGRVRIESEVGRGSRFVLELPIREMAAPAAPMPPS